MAKKKKKAGPGARVLFGGALVVLPAALPGLWGGFQKAVCEGYGITKEQAGVIFVCTIASFGIACVFTGLISDKAPPKWVAFCGALLILTGFCSTAFLPGGKVLLLCLAYSLPVGLGCACLYPTAMGCVQKFYPQNKGFATGIMGASLGFGGTAIAYASRALTAAFGIRVCFFAMGVALFLPVAAGALQLYTPKTLPPQQSGGKNQTPRQMVATPMFYLLLAATFFATPTTQLFAPGIIEMGVERGLSEGGAVFSLALSSLCNGAGRFVLPLLSDKFGRPKTAVASYLCLFAASAGFAFAAGWFLPVIYGLVTFFYSGQNAVMPAFCTDLFGFKHSGINYGLVALGMAGGAVLFPPIAAVYGPGYLPRHGIAAVSAVLAAVCVALAAITGAKTQKTQSRNKPGKTIE